MKLINIFYSVCLIIIGFEWLRRAVWMSGFRKNNPPLVPTAWDQPSSPKLSILVPSKNEENNLPNCIDHLLKQDYPNYEIIIINDRSSDATAVLADQYARNYPDRVRTLHIETLPEGWTGKNHAMTKGSEIAQGQWLLFTDADTTHAPSSASTAMKACTEQNIDYLTLAPETQCHSFWEHVVQPLAVSSLAFWFNADQVNLKNKKYVLSNGQFILIKADVYKAVGTNAIVKHQVVEDVEFAKCVIHRGYQVRFLNGTRLYKTRMYSSLAQIQNGWVRIFTHLFYKDTAALWHKIFLFVFFSLFSFMIAFKQWEYMLWESPAFDPLVLNLSLGVSALILALRAFGNKLTKTNPLYSLLHPLGSLVMIQILLVCIYRIKKNRPSAWKGDLVR